VGFQKVQPLDTSGRIFTMVFILFGIGIMCYVASAIVDELVLGRIAEALGGVRRNRRLQHMHDRYVICGYGRVGAAVGQELLSQGVQVVVIDSDESHVMAARDLGMTGVLGDATEEAVLLQANCDEAKAVVASSQSEAANTFIALTVRAMHVAVFIVAGARSAGAEARLKTASADRVVSMHRIAGWWMALAAMQPMLIDVVDTLAGMHSGAVLAEMVIEGSTELLAGRTLEEVFEHAASTRVLGLERDGGALIAGPADDIVLRLGDRLMLYGEQDDIEGLRADSSHPGAVKTG
jgi:voltage-gated potassium channel